MIKIFEQGDVNSGGDFKIKSNGDIGEDNTLGSLIYTSLFNGSSPMDVISKINHSDDFENELNSKSSSLNLRKIEQAAINQTKWIIDEGLCNKINVTVTSEIENVSLKFETIVNGKIENFLFEV